MKLVSSGGKLITNEKRGLHLTDAGKVKLGKSAGSANLGKCVISD